MLVGSFPVVAQTGSAAVACVGSDRRTLQSSNPVPRLITEDVAVVYRVGVQADGREEMERSLIAELGEAAEASCRWSNPGDTHVAIVRYTGAIRLDLTLDPEDPRFQAFAVGYGTSAAAAEEAATNLDARYATYADGGVYEVVVAETWAVAAGDDAPGSSREAETAKPGVDRSASGLAPGDEFSDCDICPQMVVVPAGTFTMGSPASEEGRRDYEGPQHSVTIPAPFAVGVYEATFAEWDACVRAGGCAGDAPDDEGWGRSSRPVINVSWNDAQAYVSWLSLHTGADYRLLSEAEWEYVARAATRTARYWGESASDHCRFANGDDDYRLCQDGYEDTAPVGSFEPNAFGLFDVLGNVSEWTQDCWDGSYGDPPAGYAGAPTDGSAWEPEYYCIHRALRGGSWGHRPWRLRSADRDGFPSDFSHSTFGFRVARTLN